MSKEIHIRLSLYVDIKDKEYTEEEVQELSNKIIEELLYNKDLSVADKRILKNSDVNHQIYSEEIQVF